MADGPRWIGAEISWLSTSIGGLAAVPSGAGRPEMEYGPVSRR